MYIYILFIFYVLYFYLFIYIYVFVDLLLMYRSCLPNLKSQNSLFLGLGGWWGGGIAREFPLKGVQCFGMHEISSFTIKLWNFMWLPSISQVKIWNPPIATTIAKWMFRVPGVKIIGCFFLISWQNGFLRSKPTVVHTGWSNPNNKIHKSL